MNAAERTDPLQAALTRFLRDGDDGAMAQIVRATRPRLLAVARRIGDGRDAEDAVQSAYLSLVRHRGGTLDVPLVPWLITATLRIAYRHKAIRRREERLAGLLSREARWDRGPLADAMTAEDAEALRREVDRLPPDYRDVVVLHYLQGLATAEAALLLETSDASVRKRLERARRLLRDGRLRRLAALAAFVPWGLADWTKRLAPARTALIFGGTMKTSAAVVGFVIAAALGAAVGAASSARRGAAPTESADAASRDEVAALRAQLAEKDAKLRAAEERAARAPRQRAAQETAAPEAEAAASSKPAGEPAKSEPSAPSAASPSIAAGAVDDALRRVDWKIVGAHMNAMLSTLRDVSRAMDRHETPPPDADRRLNEHAEPLFGALAALGHDVPGTGVMGVFTNAGVLANVIAAALEEGKLPLSKAQSATLAAMAQRFAVDDAARTSRYDAHTFELRKVVEEADVRQRFIASALETLTPEQRELVSPPAVRDRLDGDLVSTSLFWKNHVEPLGFVDAAQFSTKAVDSIVRLAGLRDDQRADLRAVVDRWTPTLPAAWFDDTPNALDVAGSTRVSVTAELARREVELLEGLPTALRLDAAETERVRAVATTWRLTRNRAK